MLQPMLTFVETTVLFGLLAIARTLMLQAITRLDLLQIRLTCHLNLI